MTKYSLFKIKSGKRALFEEWCNAIMTTYRQESIDTLVEEDLVREQCIILGEGDESYVYYMHQPLKGREKKPANMERELNKKHFDILAQCLERVPGTFQIGYDLEVST